VVGHVEEHILWAILYTFHGGQAATLKRMRKTIICIRHIYLKCLGSLLVTIHPWSRYQGFAITSRWSSIVPKCCVVNSMSLSREVQCIRFKWSISVIENHDDLVENLKKVLTVNIAMLVGA
jgi:hypothetical protein